MRKKTKLLSMAMLSATLSIAQNFTSVYNFTDVTNSSGLMDPTPPPLVENVFFGNFSAVGTSKNSNAGGRFSLTDWSVGAIDADDTYLSLKGSVTTSEYYEVTIAPENGYSLDLTDITFTVQRSSTGIRTYVVRSSIDGFTTNLSASINPANAKLSVQSENVFFWNQDAITTAQIGSTITLGGTSYSNISSAITFRFYGYNAEGTAGTFSIDNVTIKGAVSATTSIAKSLVTESVNVYPNPSLTGVFTVNVANGWSETVIEVNNMMGELVFAKQLTTSENKIDLSELPNGSYIVSFKINSLIRTEKIVINK